jgi:hypothetical protein
MAVNSDELFKQMRDALSLPRHSTRIVLDLQVGEPVRLLIDAYADQAIEEMSLPEKLRGVHVESPPRDEPATYAG